MKIIITGATGMVGSEVLRQALADETFEEVTVIVRRPTSMLSPKLKTVIHGDFLDYSGLEEVFAANDACIWCLGISQNAVSADEYVVITHDYMIAAAEAMLKANPGITLLFLSGHGAHTSGESRYLFGRVKGKTENELLQMPFDKLYIARPAGILPVRSDAHFTFTLRMQYLLVRIFRFITPWYVITSTSLAKALLHIIKYGAADKILTYQQLNQIAGQTAAMQRLPNVS